MEISMCGKELADCILEDTDKSPVSADQSDCDTLDEAGEVEMTAAEVQQIFNKRLLSKEKVNKIISKGFSHQSIEGQDQQLICRVGNVLIKWTDVSNMVMTYLAFQDFPEECPKYVLHLQPSLPIVSFKWNMRKALERKTSQQEEKWRFFSWLSSTFRTPSKAQAEENTEATAQQQSQEAEESANANATADSGQNSRRGSLKENGKAKEGEESSTSSMFTPSALELEMLNLKDGQNTVTFSCYSSLWGTQTASAYIYLMPWNSKVVVSDVDGTITKSDVMGHVMTAIGKDWTHAGVSKLLKDIRTNGYHVMYLSARSIGQASVTRDFLFNLDQNGAKLPLGPVIISPDGILPSLFREMILKRPHEFKIACLQTIKDLFPKDWNPFFAGFGNRETDEFSYSAVGIPTSKIFTINPKGQVTLNSASTFKTSQRRTLQGINELVDEIFPQLKLKEGEDDVDHDQFSGYNFWKVPVMIEEIEI
jgi:phosphatidate phosphatase PAH1